MMASSGSEYPDHLNPFGDDEEEHQVSCSKQNDYPDHLDPFGTDEVPNEQEVGLAIDDYDDSLNPFGNEAATEHTAVREPTSVLLDRDDNNPFAEEMEQELKQQDVDETKTCSPINEQPNNASITPSFDSLEPPPKPLPRTKSLLKKEQAHKRRLQELQKSTLEVENHLCSLQSTTSSTISSSSTTTTDTSHRSATNAGLFQQRKNKRLAPPVPINFKRQVTGSLEEIETELNDIGDKLAIIDKESIVCQAMLTNSHEVDKSDLKITKSKFKELIRRRNSILRRQKELMYKKRELTLDQLYSDIEYELRMIGNKQLSIRTQEDEAREKELLKKLVEVVEEKNDIVENLNKDTPCDGQDIEEAFKRLNIQDYLPEDSDRNSTVNGTKVASNSEHCDKGKAANQDQSRGDEFDDLDSLSREGKPCICNSTFFKYCPPASECSENFDFNASATERPRDRQLRSWQKKKPSRPPVNPEHDDLHPDHVDMQPFFKDDPVDENQAYQLHLPHLPASFPQPDRVRDGRVPRRRKVYVTRRNDEALPQIHTIKVTVPLKVKQTDELTLPEPPSIYRLKKYTTYESKPEIQMVPVTKTIIKPVGVTKEQIIDGKDEAIFLR